MPCNETHYSISDLSKMYSINSSTLRYYEDIGLLSEVERTASNQRVYTQEHVNRLNAIECFKRTGLPISKMLDFFSYEQTLTTNIDDIIELVSTHEQNMLRQIEEMQKDLVHIQKKVRYYNAIKQSYENNTPFPCYDTI